MLNAQDFITLPKKDAQSLAEQLNLIFRLVRVDDRVLFGYPTEDDKREDRICVEIENNRVVSASIQ